MIYNLRGHPDEEVDHEENVEGEVDLLCRVLYPRSAGFYTIPENREWDQLKLLEKRKVVLKEKVTNITS